MPNEQDCMTVDPRQNVAMQITDANNRRNSGEIKPIICEGTTSLELPIYRGNPWWKRACDMVGSIALLGISFPVLVAVAAYIKLVSKGPIFFCQPRVGAGGKHFTIIKFRTMNVRPDASAEHREYVGRLASQNAPIEKPDYLDRLIRGGEFLRCHSIDELPQLINVLFGTMSLVGPRPDVMELEDYEQWHLRRFEVLPGMTGLWQVSGKNRLSFREMVELDIRYIDHRSLRLDLQILWKTLAVVMHQDNA